MTSRADAEARDRASTGWRDRVLLPEGIIYLDGNSLGPVGRGVPERVAEVVQEEWSRGLIGSWNDADWSGLARRVGDRIAPLVGVAPGEVQVGDSTSVSLFKAMVAAARHRPDRTVLVIEEGTFPTDGYIAAGVADLLGLELRWCDRADPLASVDDDVALVSLTHVDFRTGEMLDLAATTAAVHERGALMLWDLCHSTGAVPVDLTAAGADIAVGCTYKYLNGGPGSPAFTWVSPALHDELRQPITGWWGHAAPFAMARDYEPAPGVTRWTSGTPPILALSTLHAALDAFEGITPAELRARSLSLTDYFIELLGERLPDLEVVTPLEHERRGSQVSVRHPAAYGVVQALIARGVVGDFREPDIARFGFAPLYLTHADVHDAVDHLVLVLAGEEHLDPAYTTRRTVT